MSLFKILTYRTFVPTEISGLKVWLDNDTLGADGSAVSTWADSSGNGFDFVQPTISFQPDIYTDGTRKTVRMNADSLLACPSGVSILKNVAGATIFTVYRPDNTLNPLLYITDGINSFSAGRLGQSNAANAYLSGMKILDGGTVNSVISTKTLDTANYTIHETSANFAQNDIYQYLDGQIDGSSILSGGSNTSNTNSAAIFLGGLAQVPHAALVPSASLRPQATVFATIKYLEVLIFNRNLTSLEKSAVENYLSIKHSVPLA